MKLFRHGPPGSEKPGLIDARGAMRDLSGMVAGLAGTTLTPDSMARLAALDQIGMPHCLTVPVWAIAWVAWPTSSAEMRRPHDSGGRS